MIRLLYAGALGAASNNVVKERQRYSRQTATSFAMRHEPLGDSRLSPQAHVMVIQSNHEVEVVCSFLEQALLCSSRFVSVLLALPEDLGGIPFSGPAIICELHQ